jgi:N-methylhydantoinase A
MRGESVGYDVCIDIGGTFTDCVVSNGSRVEIVKAASTPPAFERGFMDALGLAAATFDVDLPAFLAATDSLVHGTTVATNALVQRQTGSVGLVCNEGHPDVLTFREAPRKRAFDWKLDYPKPFVPRNRTVEVRGRIDARGNEITPLSEADVRDAVDYFKKCSVDAIAVSLLWSVVEPAHEQRAGEIVRSLWPEIPVTLSHALNPMPREYRRTIATAIDASLHTIVPPYLDRLERAVREAGFTGTLLVANCLGGMMTVDEIVARPIYALMSGPTLAPIASLALTDEPDVIVIDMGGTTFDVSAIRARELILTTETLINDDLLGLPKIDVRSVGAGGGSIAWVDSGGLLRVGPLSAGAEPGPACYGRGGTRPTVTDANLVLGILDPDYFLGGRLALDRDAARRAVAMIADPLGLGVPEAAYAIHVTSNENMIAAIEDITVNEGIDPRDSYVVAGGGATSCHIGEMAAALGLNRFMVPALAAGLSAFGGLISDIRGKETATLHTSNRHFALEAVNQTLIELRDRGTRFLDRAGVRSERRRYEYAFQARYKYQSWEIDVSFEPTGGLLREADLPTLVDAFHQMHERIYTIKEEDDEVEFTTWTVRAIGANQTNVQHSETDAITAELPMRGSRAVFMGATRAFQDLPVYDGTAPVTGAVVRGPALIDSDTTTILLLAGHRADIDARGNFCVETEEAGGA